MRIKELAVQDGIGYFCGADSRRGVKTDDLVFNRVTFGNHARCAKIVEDGNISLSLSKRLKKIGKELTELTDPDNPVELWRWYVMFVFEDFLKANNFPSVLFGADIIRLKRMQEDRR